MKTKRKSFDWEQVRSRLRESQAALDDAFGNRQRIETVYEERAARLARRRALATTATTFRALVFALGSERYAIELEVLAEVLPCPVCTPVPGAPPELLGVINLRGEVRPIVDLARLLELPVMQSDSPGFVLLLRYKGREIGFKVGRVDQIRVLASEAFEHQGAARCLKGLARDGLMILSVEKLFKEAW